MITITILPLIWWLLPSLIWGGLAGGLAGFVSAAIIDSLKDNRRFAILGDSASGKTTLLNFLTEGEVHMGEYKQTENEEYTKKNTLKLKDEKLIVEEGVDIGGADEHRNQWEGLIEKANVVCYLIRGDRVFAQKKDYISLINEHISLILDFKKEEQKLYLLITFLDVIPQYLEDADTVKKQINDTLKTSAFRKGTKVIYGSLGTKESAENLVYRLIKDISKK